MRLRFRAHNALQFSFFFFFFFSSLTGFWRDCLKLFSKSFIINFQGSVWPSSDSFLGHTKKPFCNKCSSSSYSRRVWHMTRLKRGNQHSRHPKSTRNSQKLGNKLVSREKSRLIVKSLKKQKMFRLRNWLLLHVKKYKSCFWRHLSSENVI